MRILAVDTGSKRIGLAISDPTGTISRPLTVIKHVSRMIDAAAVASIAAENGVRLIVVGQSTDNQGQLTFEGRRAGRFVLALRAQTGILVTTWDEAFTTRDAREIRISMGVSRQKRSGHLDDLAASVLLQSYLDSLDRS